MTPAQDATALADKATHIKLRPSEIQSGSDRVRWAEGLIRQLPPAHDGRNSWLVNYAGTFHEVDKVALRATSQTPDAVRAVEIVRLIDLLRSQEGDSVEILCDNPDFNGQPNCAVVCNGDWTGWEDRRFVADTVLDALSSAAAEYNLPAPRPIIAESNGHHWVQRFSLTCCRDCGIVRRADDQNNPCKGVVRVGPRSTPSTSAGPQAEAVSNMISIYRVEEDDDNLWVRIPGADIASVKLNSKIGRALLVLEADIRACDAAHAQSQQADGRGAVIEAIYGGVGEAQFLEAYPLPWNAIVHTGTNRSQVVAADGTQIINGMNNAKAAFIADAANRRALQQSPATDNAPAVGAQERNTP